MSGGASPDAIQLAPQDKVATALRAIAAGETVHVRSGERVVAVTAAGPVPFCHKVSLAPIGAGEAVVKYGETIGLALEAIGAGRHVHVHNMWSARGRAPAAGGAPR